MRSKTYFFSLLTIVLISSTAVCQQSTISGKIFSRQNNNLVSVAGVDVYIECVQSGKVTRGQSNADGQYNVTFDKCETINVTYGNGVYLPELVPGLPGEMDQKVTKVLVKYDNKVRLTPQQSTLIISTLQHIQSNPQDFDLGLRRLAMKLDESIVPPVMDQQLINLRLNSIRQEGNMNSMVPLSFNGTILNQSDHSITVQTPDGQVLRVGVPNSARCGYVGNGLTKCDSAMVNPHIVGLEVAVDAVVNSIHGIALADRVRYIRCYK